MAEAVFNYYSMPKLAPKKQMIYEQDESRPLVC